MFRVFLVPVVCFYCVILRRSYLSSQDYLQRMHRAVSGFPRPRPWHSFYHFWTFGEALLDKLSVWMGDITRKDVVLHGGDIIDELLATEQGALILISHLGNFEVCQALSESRPELRLTVLHHTKHMAKFNRVLSDVSRKSSVDLLQVTDIDMVVAMQLSEKISAGQFIAISADRVAVDNVHRSAVLNFLGDPAPFPTGPFLLARALQAPVLTIHCIREAGCYHIYFEMLWQGGVVGRSGRRQHIDTLMKAYVERLAYYCRKAPWQWYNFYSFWKTGSGPTGNTSEESSS